MSGHRERERKIDVNKMSIEQADALSVQIGQAIGKIMDEANTKCNELLNIYGMHTQIHYQIKQIGESIEEKPKKRKYSKKQSKTQSLEHKS